MDIQTKIRKCLTKWMTDMDLWMEMRLQFNYEGSPGTLSRERRKVCEKGGIDERKRPNKNGVMYKQFRVEK